ncbi:MAG: hypothetical protein WCO35_00360 [Candidatus Nomurabacteria bacterium]
MAELKFGHFIMQIILVKGKTKEYTQQKIDGQPQHGYPDVKRAETAMNSMKSNPDSILNKKGIFFKIEHLYWN